MTTWPQACSRYWCRYPGLHPGLTGPLLVRGCALTAHYRYRTLLSLPGGRDGSTSSDALLRREHVLLAASASKTCRPHHLTTTSPAYTHALPPRRSVQSRCHPAAACKMHLQSSQIER